MKKIKYIFLALTLMLSVSCDDFLVEETYGTPTVEEILTSKAKAEMFLYTIYNSVRDQHDRYYVTVDCGTDDQSCDDGDSDGIEFALATHSMTSDEGYVTTAFWTEWWEMINRANFCIDAFPEIGMDTDYTNQAVAEARTLRAYAYFHLVRLWGNIPKIDWFVERDNFSYTQDLPRTDVMEIYEDIIVPDLMFGFQYGVDYQSKQGRVSKWLAGTLLSEVYMTLAGNRWDSITGEKIAGDPSYWGKARDVASEVINNCTSYQLIEDAGAYESPYARIWSEEYCSEVLFEVGYINDSNQGSLRTRNCILRTRDSWWKSDDNLVFPGEPDLIFSTYSTLEVSADTYAVVTPDLFRAFEDGDERKWGMLTIYRVNEGTADETAYINPPCFRKNICFKTALSVAGDDYSDSYDTQNARLYRLADVMLAFAEADNELNGPTYDALAQINRLRNRAGLADAILPGSQDEMRELIHHERRIELHGEFKRRFDLVRWDKLSLTRDYAQTWEPYDNPISDGSGYNMEASWQNMHIFEEGDTFLEYNCTAPSEMPFRSAFMCFQNEVLMFNPDWPQNYGY